jgi:hypothetical protein
LIVDAKTDIKDACFIGARMERGNEPSKEQQFAFEEKFARLRDKLRIAANSAEALFQPWDEGGALDGRCTRPVTDGGRIVVPVDTSERRTLPPKRVGLEPDLPHAGHATSLSAPADLDRD